MEIRGMTATDLEGIKEIDATGESSQYLHVERGGEHGGEGLAASWKMEVRPLREKRVNRHALDDEQHFAIRQIVTGAEEGIALAAEHEGHAVAAAVATPDRATGVMRLVDLRVDYDFRRQGLASALMFQLIQRAREEGFRAVMARTAADDFPSLQLLGKLGFEATGLDTHFHSNHDLVKESVTLFFYLTLD